MLIARRRAPIASARIKPDAVPLPFGSGRLPDYQLTSLNLVTDLSQPLGSLPLLSLLLTFRLRRLRPPQPLVCEHTFVPTSTHGFTIVERDPGRPWIVLSQQHQTVTLAHGVDFARWAEERWPSSRFEVQLDPKLDPWEGKI